MEKYSLNLRHRAHPDEAVVDRHAKIKQALAKFEPPWGYGSTSVPDVVVDEAELVSIVELDKLSGRGLKSYIAYKYRDRKYLRDNAQYDDFLIIEFKPSNPDLGDFVQRVFPEYIVQFDCYRASILNRQIGRNDWNDIVERCESTKKDVNGRDGVYRINEINFFDRELCKRAFDLTPENIVERLQGQVEKVALLHDGVMIVYASRLLPIEQLESIDTKVRRLLGI